MSRTSACRNVKRGSEREKERHAALSTRYSRNYSRESRQAERATALECSLANADEFALYIENSPFSTFARQDLCQESLCGASRAARHLRFYDNLSYRRLYCFATRLSPPLHFRSISIISIRARSKVVHFHRVRFNARERRINELQYRCIDDDSAKLSRFAHTTT